MYKERPKLEDFKVARGGSLNSAANGDFVPDYERYSRALDKYCDELNKWLDEIEHVVIPDYERVQSELWKLQEDNAKLRKSIKKHLNLG